MTPFSRFLILFVCLFAFSGAAFARDHRKADMFEENNLSTYSRPSVPSDAARGQDVIPKVPNLYNKDADLFDGISRGFRHVNQEMLHARPQRYVGGPLFVDPNS